MRKIGIRQQFFIAMIIAIIPVMICGWLLFQWAYGLLLQSASDLMAQQIISLANQADRVIGEIDGKTSHLVRDADLRRLLEEDAYGENLRRAEASIMEAMNTIDRGEADEVVIQVVDRRMRIVASSYPHDVGRYRILGAPWLNKIIENRGELVMLSGYNISRGNELESIRVVYLARAILNADGYVTGYLVVEIPTAWLSDIFGEVQLGSGFIVLLDPDNYSIYSTHDMLVGRRLGWLLGDTVEEDRGLREIGGEEMLVVDYYSYTTGFTLVGLVPVQELRREILQVQSLFLIAIFITGSLVIVLALGLSYGITIPIVKLTSFMKEVKTGNLSLRITPDSNAEIAQMQTGVNEMLERLEEMIETVFNAQMREKEARFDFLMATINPHFLYNTLESISMKAYLNDDEEVVEMLGNLSDLFRASIAEGSPIIPISREIEHAKSYLSLQQHIKSGVFEVRWDVDNALMNCKTLKFLLQPVVENTVLHGFTGRSGVVEIAVKENAHGILFRVCDDGVGISPERLAQIEYALEQGSDGDFSTLSNIHSRIKHTFGSKYGLEVANRRQGGTVTEILIPRQE